MAERANDRGGVGLRTRSPPGNRQRKSTGGTPVPRRSDKTTQGESLDHEWPIPEDKLRRKLAVPSQGRLYYLRYAMKMGWTIEQIHELTNIDPWFLAQMKQLVDFEDELIELEAGLREAVDQRCDEFAETGSRCSRLISAQSSGAIQRCAACRASGINAREFRECAACCDQPVYKLVDTCAAEFEAATPYYYSTYETAVHRQRRRMTVSEDEIRLTDRPKVIIIGGGPNRIGQGIEFDYCCVQAAFAMRELGFESVMINSNPGDGQHRLRHERSALL